MFSVHSVVEHLIRRTGKGTMKHITLCIQGYQLKLAGFGCSPNLRREARIVKCYSKIAIPPRLCAQREAKMPGKAGMWTDKK